MHKTHHVYLGSLLLFSLVTTTSVVDEQTTAGPVTTAPPALPALPALDPLLPALDPLLSAMFATARRSLSTSTASLAKVATATAPTAPKAAKAVAAEAAKPKRPARRFPLKKALLQEQYTSTILKAPAVLLLDGLQNYATLPTMDQLRGQLVGLLSAPASRLTGILSQNQQSLVMLLGQRVKDMEGAAAGGDAPLA
ncbi:hypothetical protein AMAG_05430 [Allomyces macrogynus ATCC 38327]|uniref:Uncharacterized protein n=1 Tax=Allomyces macrogynus (strain ATCC 38327) TaxID=578462 RepID=A0A0L0SC29_ALLM3|nr:hypothetical protein AMAG_05430 [Allomyces macrogynus ATCC 38327]|eukprot:KNE59987.1 hypothetical protein AMAG_05430 [Allomyces macrogynus ATCC 38327]